MTAPGALRGKRAARALLARMFGAAVAAASEFPGLPDLLPAPPQGRTALLSVGKAAVPMARGLAQACRARGHALAGGLVVVPRGCARPCPPATVIEASHPVPDGSSVRAARRALALARELGSDDLLLAAFSGGGSSLLCAPLPGMGLRAKRQLSRALLRSGMDIARMNCLRSQFSLIKGGRIAEAASPAKVVTFVVSDIPGDDPALVASGPTLPPRFGAGDALEIADSCGDALPPWTLEMLRGAARRGPQAKGSPSEVRAHLLATSSSALAAAKAAAESVGVAAEVLSDRVDGDAEDVARDHAAAVRKALEQGRRLPLALLSGGETTVRVPRSAGRGGRNTTFLLRLALELEGAGNIHALAADTDGIDGCGAAAGAFCDRRTPARLRALGVDPEATLLRRDSHSAFDALGDLLVTGPTGTNVNDLRAILIER